MQMVAEEIGGRTFIIERGPGGMTIVVDDVPHGPVPFAKVQEALNTAVEHEGDSLEFVHAFALEGELSNDLETRLVALVQGAIYHFDRYPPRAAS